MSPPDIDSLETLLRDCLSHRLDSFKEMLGESVEVSAFGGFGDRGWLDERAQHYFKLRDLLYNRDAIRKIAEGIIQRWPK